MKNGGCDARWKVAVRAAAGLRGSAHESSSDVRSFRSHCQERWIPEESLYAEASGAIVGGQIDCLIVRCGVIQAARPPDHAGMCCWRVDECPMVPM